MLMSELTAPTLISDVQAVPVLHVIDRSVVVEFKALLMRTMTFLHGRPLEPLLVAYA
jgi:hypothetical protein